MVSVTQLLWVLLVWMVLGQSGLAELYLKIHADQ